MLYYIQFTKFKDITIDQMQELVGEDFIMPTILYEGKGEVSTMYLSLGKRTIRLGLFCYKTENSIFHIVNIVVVSLRPLHTVQPCLPVPTTLSLLEMAKRVPVLPLGINLFQFLHCFNIRRKMLSFPPSRWSLYKTYTIG